MSHKMPWVGGIVITRTYDDGVIEFEIALINGIGEEEKMVCDQVMLALARKANAQADRQVELRQEVGGNQ